MQQRPPVDRIVRFIGDKTSWLYLIAVLISLFEIISDSVFGAPTIWVHDLTIMLCAACFLIGGAYAMQRREHIRITVIYDLMPDRIQRWLDGVSLVLALVFMCALSYFTTTQAIESITLIERSGRAWNFPMPMVIRTIFSLACLLLTVQIASRLVELIRSREPVEADIDPVD